MILEVARAILGTRRNEPTRTHTYSDAEREAFEQRMARLGDRQFAWPALSALADNIAQRRGRFR